MIAYKVVEKNTRHCSNWLIHKSIMRAHGKDYEFISNKTRDRKKDFFPRYLKGRIIRAVSDSPGIMCFESIEHCNEFIENSWEHTKNGIIIKVRGIKRMYFPGMHIYEGLIVAGSGYSPEKLANRNFNMKQKLAKYGTNPPLGTIFFESVEVLE